MKKVDFSPDKYLSSLYGTHASPFAGVTDGKSARIAGEELRKKLRDILAVDKIPFKTNEAVPEVLKSEDRGEYEIQTLRVEICKDLPMLCYVLIPREKKGDGIVAFCGHGYGCRQIIRQSKNGAYRKINFLDNYQKNFASELAKTGHTVIVPEPVGFGEAKMKNDSLKPFYSSSCDTVSHHCLLYGFSTASLRVYQVMRCVDVLQKNYGCEKIGCMGISGGGLVSLYASCLDGRIEKTCVCGYINTFRTSVLSMWHCPDNYVPSLLENGEMYDYASCLAPGKLMMQYGDRDRLFPIEGSLEAAKNIKRIYELEGCPENFVPCGFKGKHEVYLPAAIEFFNGEG